MRGGYVNIDEYANMLNLLRRSHDDDWAMAPTATTSLGNQDWANGVIELPPDAHL